jgi:hypothetical protein
MKNLFLLLSILIILGCPSIKNKPESNFISNIKESIVFGRFQILQNGFDDTSVKHILFFYPLISTTNGPTRDNWAIPYKKQLDFQNGYFFLSLPPGKYCLNHIAYYPTKFFGITNSNNKYLTVLAISGTIPNHNVISNISLVSFEVSPNQANYIGTIKIETTCCYFRECIGNQEPVSGYEFTSIDKNDVNNKPFWKYGCSSPTLKVDEWNVINEYEKALLQFRIQYPNHSEAITNLANLSTKIGEKQDGTDYQFFDIEDILKKYRITGFLSGSGLFGY